MDCNHTRAVQDWCDAELLVGTIEGNVECLHKDVAEDSANVAVVSFVGYDTKEATRHAKRIGAIHQVRPRRESQIDHVIRRRLTAAEAKVDGWIDAWVRNNEAASRIEERVGSRNVRKVREVQLKVHKHVGIDLLM